MTTHHSQVAQAVVRSLVSGDVSMFEPSPGNLNAKDIALIASMPIVKLNFPGDLQRWQFACYYLTMQAKSSELLSLRTMIDRYARASSNDLVADAPELIDEVLA